VGGEKEEKTGGFPLRRPHAKKREKKGRGGALIRRGGKKKGATISSPEGEGRRSLPATTLPEKKKKRDTP